MNEKTINNGIQHGYHLEGQRFTFNYMSSGSMEIKTCNRKNSSECLPKK